MPDAAMPALSPDAVVLHIGPHKTGTTAIQGALYNARKQLGEHGAAYAGPGRQPYLAALFATNRLGRRGDVPDGRRGARRRGPVPGGEPVGHLPGRELAAEVRQPGRPVRGDVAERQPGPLNPQPVRVGRRHDLGGRPPGLRVHLEVQEHPRRQVGVEQRAGGRAVGGRGVAPGVVVERPGVLDPEDREQPARGADGT